MAEIDRLLDEGKNEAKSLNEKISAGKLVEVELFGKDMLKGWYDRLIQLDNDIDKCCRLSTETLNECINYFSSVKPISQPKWRYIIQELEKVSTVMAGKPLGKWLNEVLLELKTAV